MWRPNFYDNILVGYYDNQGMPVLAGTLIFTEQKHVDCLPRSWVIILVHLVLSIQHTSFVLNEAITGTNTVLVMCNTSMDLYFGFPTSTPFDMTFLPFFVSYGRKTKYRT